MLIADFDSYRYLVSVAWKAVVAAKRRERNYFSQRCLLPLVTVGGQPRPIIKRAGFNQINLLIFRSG